MEHAVCHRITLYPVRDREPGTLIFHARVKARPSKHGTHQQKRSLDTLGRVGHTSVLVVSAPLSRSADQKLGCSTAPVGTTPVVRYRHSAIISLRATATIVIRRMRPLRSPTRWRNQRLNSLSG